MTTRRKFLQYGFLSTSVVLFDGCNLFGITTPYKTLSVLQYDLVPKAQELGLDVNSYIHTVLRHSHILESDKTFLKNGVKWLNEECVKAYRKEYVNLPIQKRQSILQKVAQTGWGEDFLYDVMSYTFEAMLGDPIYGANKNEAGWQWLHFQGGQPRPKRAYL